LLCFLLLGNKVRESEERPTKYGRQQFYLLAVNYGVAVGSGVASTAGGGATSVVGVSSAPSHAPRVVAKPNNKAKPKILIFITPLSPI
jgi:hypothetical protein